MEYLSHREVLAALGELNLTAHHYYLRVLGDDKVEKWSLDRYRPKSLFTAILLSFSFYQTKEGISFWNELVNAIQQHENIGVVENSCS